MLMYLETHQIEYLAECERDDMEFNIMIQRRRCWRLLAALTNKLSEIGENSFVCQQFRDHFDGGGDVAGGVAGYGGSGGGGVDDGDGSGGGDGGCGGCCGCGGCDGGDGVDGGGGDGEL